MLKKRYSLFALTYLLFISLSIESYAAGTGARLVGDIEPSTGLYTAIDKSFTVILPIKGAKRYVISAITDTFSSRGTVISIEPQKGAGKYRLETSNVVNTAERATSFSEASAKTFDWYRRIAKKSYKSELIELISQPFKLKGQQAVSTIYKQLSSDKKGPRFHLFYLVDFGDKLAFAWTDIPLKEDDLDIEEKIITGKAKQSLKSIAMLRSLNFN